MEEKEKIEDLSFEIGSGFSVKGGFDKPTLIHECIGKIFLKRAEEMRAGYTTSIMDKQGNILPKIILDTRKQFIGSVEALTSILSFEIESNQDAKKSYEKYVEGKKKLFDKFCYHERAFEINGSTYKIVIAKDSDEWMPEINEYFEIPKEVTLTNFDGTPYSAFEMGNYVGGTWDSKVNRYWNGILILCDEWFANINKLISEGLLNFSKRASA